MRKYLEITTIDPTAKTYLIELGGQHDIGRPLNHPEFIGAAVNVARSGFCIDPKAKEPVIIAPSQIKSVQIIQQ